MTYTDHLLCDTFPYVTPAELMQCCKNAQDLEATDYRILDAIDDASTVMYYLTGRQFSGTCQTTVRPGCLTVPCHCGCTPNQVNLGVWPVTQLNSVRYGGVVYTGASLTDTFHVNGFRFIARNDGDTFLSGNQSAVAGSSQDSVDALGGTVFEATVSYGMQVPRLITRATRDLACNLVAVCCEQPCKLPERVTSVVRSGISMQMASVVDLLRTGDTGIYSVNLAIATFNPSRLQSPSFVWAANTDSRNGTRVGT